MGIISGLIAANNAKRVGELFRSTYFESEGEYPSEPAVECVRTAATIVDSFAGTGRERYGAEKLSGAVDDLARSLNYVEERIAIGIGILMTMALNPKTMRARRGYEWALNVFDGKTWEHCPNLCKQ